MLNKKKEKQIFVGSIVELSGQVEPEHHRKNAKHGDEKMKG
jgi:hypothetical protein